MPGSRIFDEAKSENETPTNPASYSELILSRLIPLVMLLLLAAALQLPGQDMPKMVKAIDVVLNAVVEAA